MRDLHTWAPNYVDRKGTIDNFLNKFGQNFRRFPRIYRYGIYKRAVVFAKKGDYLKAYKSIAENFNIKEIKIEFQDKDIHKPHTIFTDEKLDLDEELTSKIPVEDFKD